MRAPSDGKASTSIIAGDNDVVRTDILEKKQEGEFREKTLYKVRKVIIPMDVPKQTVRG
jgi:hypothetical protein